MKNCLTIVLVLAVLLLLTAVVGGIGYGGYKLATWVAGYDLMWGWLVAGLYFCLIFLPALFVLGHFWTIPKVPEITAGG